MSDDGKLNPSAQRRPLAPEPRKRSRLRLQPAVAVALSLTMLFAPALLFRRTAHHRHTTVLAGASGSDWYGPGTPGLTPATVLTGAHLPLVRPDGLPIQEDAHIASVSAASLVTAPPTTPPPAAAPRITRLATTTAAPATTAPPTTTPPTTTPPTTTPPTTAPPTTEALPPPRTTTTTAATPQDSETGPASWYDASAGTCAHPSLPFGTVVTVTNLANGATTACTVEDRGPFQGGRIIDLAEATFAQIASPSDGVIQVQITW